MERDRLSYRGWTEPTWRGTGSVIGGGKDLPGEGSGIGGGQGLTVEGQAKVWELDRPTWRGTGPGRWQNGTTWRWRCGVGVKCKVSTLNVPSVIVPTL